MGPVAIAWAVSVGGALGVRVWNALVGPLLWGYDAPGHLAYVFYLDRYGFVPWAHQGWGYFHPPLHYFVGLALAQFGNAEILLRGTALFGSFASVAIAGLAALVVRSLTPERPTLPLLAFVSVAFLPVHLYASPMNGNEMTCAFFGAAALCALIANERRPVPSIRWDAATGILVGLALLTKFTGATFLAAVVGTIALRPSYGLAASGWGRALARASVVAVAAGLVAGPFYARNLAEYGTPFRMNRDYALTADIEAAQPPGIRTWRDFVYLSPRLLLDPSPRAPHLIHSVWGTAYVNAWVDTRALWNRLPQPDATRVRQIRRAMVWFGLPLTGLALVGAVLVIRDARRGRRLSVAVPVLVFTAVVLVAFGLFALRVPRISALKATYLLGLSVPLGVFVARAVEAFGPHRRLRSAVAASVLIVGAVSAVGYTQGVGFPRRDHHGALGAVHLLVGDPSAARRFYEGRLARAPTRSLWLEGLAGVELDSGDPRRALTLYQRTSSGNQDYGERRLQLGVAAALAGKRELARRHFDAAAAKGFEAPALSNRGAVHAVAGEWRAAEALLERAISFEPNLAPAWHSLMVVHERAGRSEAAAEARREWHRAAHTAPRDYPYGVGVGLLHPTRRPLLWVGPDGLELARAPFRPQESQE